MSHVPISAPVRSVPGPSTITLERLAECVRALDPGTRALLDLSIRRRIRDDALAPVLRTDPFHLAWRRARALERVASELGSASPASLAEVRAALSQLPGDAWFAQPQLLAAPTARELEGASESRALVPLGASSEIIIRRPTKSEHRRMLAAESGLKTRESVDHRRRGKIASAARRAVNVLRRRGR